MHRLAKKIYYFPIIYLFLFFIIIAKYYIGFNDLKKSHLSCNLQFLFNFYIMNTIFFINYNYNYIVIFFYIIIYNI